MGNDKNDYHPRIDHDTVRTVGALELRVQNHDEQIRSLLTLSEKVLQIVIEQKHEKETIDSLRRAMEVSEDKRIEAWKQVMELSRANERRLDSLESTTQTGFVKTDDHNKLNELVTKNTTRLNLFMSAGGLVAASAVSKIFGLF